MLKRFIRYLYEYEQGKRTRNVGFVKVEMEDTQSVLQIHGKGLRLKGGDALSVGLFFEENGTIWNVSQGEISYMGPSINYQLSYTDEDVGAPEYYDKIDGILLETGNGRKFAAVWDDVPVDVESIRPWSERRKSLSEADGQSAAGESVETEPPLEPILLEEAPEERQDTLDHADNAVPEKETPGKIVPESETELQMQEEVNPTCRWKVSKIQRGEISMLPRCEWRLANNNFLLHGYSNYRHLALLDDGKLLKLGVPGIYHEKEARAAAGFGFPEFIPVEETRVSLSDEECNSEEQFGYWCRQVRRPSR